MIKYILAKNPCPVCGKRALVRSDVAKTQKYCSRFCSTRKFIKPKKLCIICGEPVKQRGANRKYCSHECYCKSQVKVRPLGICLVCGKEYVVTRFNQSNKHCSRKCYWESLVGNKINLGKTHSERTRRKISLSKGGSGIPFENTEYGSEFDSQLKEKVRFRDGYKCQMCGCSQLENGRQLDCHHIDHNRKNSILNNLIALCRSCHSKTTFRKAYYIKLFNEKIRRWNETSNISTFMP